jgi:Tfp pilus assembly protein PilE
MGYREHKSSKGYTLLEMAIVFAVVGIIIATAAMAYKLYYKNQQQAQNANNMRIISSYMNSFLMQRGRYPCPARLDAARTDADYGLEGNCTDTTVAAGTCASGICVENGARQVDIDPEPAVTNMQNVRVRRGAIPFRTLAMPEKNFQDAYKMRYNYAVTEILASAGTYQRDSGAIAIVDSANQSVIAPPNSSHFVIFSSGPDRMGGYGPEGRQFSACNTTALDGENCNTSNTNIVATYRRMERNHSVGANYFDDDVLYYSSVETPLWQVSGTSGAHIRDLVEAESGGRIGIGTTAPGVTLDVGGTARSENETRLTEICNLAGGDCFAAASIGGDDPNFQCTDPANPYVVGIGMGHVTCGPAPEIRCPAGEVVVGIDATSGTLDCESPAPPIMCPPKSYTQCATEVPPGFTINLPTAVAGTQTAWMPFDPVNFSVSRKGIWACSLQSGGLTAAWTTLGTSGTCALCVPGTVTGLTDYQTCSSYMGGGYWTGTVTTDVTTTCPGNALPTTAAVVTGNTCTCTPSTADYYSSCPPGYTSGSITTHKAWVCDSATAGHWETTGTTDTCACGTATQTQTLTCPTGYTGTWTQTKTQVSCPPVVWGPWEPSSPPAGSCTCSSSPYTQTQPCPTGYTGTGVVMQAMFDCATGTMGPYDTQVAFNCSVTSYSWVTGGTPSSLGSQVGPLAGSTCSSPGATSACSVPAGAQFQPYSACTCQ